MNERPFQFGQYLRPDAKSSSLTAPPYFRSAYEVEVTFDRERMVQLWEWCSEVQRVKRSIGAQSVKVKKDRSETETNYIGILGEVALRRVVPELGEVDFSIGRTGKDRHSDFKLYGVSIEVKTMRSYLTFNPPGTGWGEFGGEIAVLINFQPKRYDRVWVQGWIPRSTFLRECFPYDFGYGKRFCLSAETLQPISTLSGFCELLASERKRRENHAS